MPEGPGQAAANFIWIVFAIIAVYVLVRAGVRDALKDFDKWKARQLRKMEKRRAREESD